MGFRETILASFAYSLSSGRMELGVITEHHVCGRKWIFREDKIMQSKKKLIVIDVQNDFVTGSLGTKEAQAMLPRLLEKVNVL